MKIAVLNTERAIALSDEGQALREKLNDFQEEVHRNRRKLTDDITELRRTIQNGSVSLSTERLQALQNDLERDLNALRRYQEDKQREADTLQREGLREIERLLTPIVQNIREEQGLDMILNHSAVIVASDAADITNLVAQRLTAAR